MNSRRTPARWLTRAASDQQVGFHIIKTEERKTQNFDEVKESFRMAMVNRRLAEAEEAYIKGLTEPLGIGYPDTMRLRHIAWLGHSTLPYAFGVTGQPAAAVYCELTAPDGSSWRFGDPAAESAIIGAAGAFCRVGAQRLAPAESGLQTRGPRGDDALRLLRNYAVV